MKLKCDLHIHSCLSPCASLEMGPKDIIQQAKKSNLNLIAISDHNTALNCKALKELSEKENIICLYGIEATSAEEAHILFIFEEIKNAINFSNYIYEYLPDIKNNPEKLGDQIIVDKDNNIINEIEKYLGNALDLSIDKLIEEGKKHNAIIIPSHIDKPVFSIISQLGFLPDLPYDAIEVAQKNAFINSTNINIICNSDAHYLEDIGKKYFEIEIDNFTFANFKNALNKNKIALHY